MFFICFVGLVSLIMKYLNGKPPPVLISVENGNGALISFQNHAMKSRDEIIWIFFALYKKTCKFVYKQKIFALNFNKYVSF